MSIYFYRVAGKLHSASLGNPEPSEANDFFIFLTLDPSDLKERRIYGLNPEDALENALTFISGLADEGRVWTDKKGIKTKSV